MTSHVNTSGTRLQPGVPLNACSPGLNKKLTVNEYPVIGAIANAFAQAPAR